MRPAWRQNPSAVATQGVAGIRSILAGERMGNPEVGEDSSHAFGRSLDGDLTWRRHFQHVAVLVAAEPSASRQPNSGRRLKKVACTLAACETGGIPVVAEAVDAAPSIVKVRKVS